MDKYTRLALEQLFEKPENIEFDWFDCTANIKCSCGAMVQLDADDEYPRSCDCGRVYRLRSFVEVAKPK